MKMQETTRQSNTSLFETSRELARGRAFNENNWGARHSKAIDDALMFSNTTPSHRQTGEAGVALMIKGWCMFADAVFPDGAVNDNFGGEPWAEIGKSIRTLLNFEMGALDCGTIDTLICEVLKNGGFNLDD